MTGAVLALNLVWVYYRWVYWAPAGVSGLTAFTPAITDQDKPESARRQRVEFFIAQ